MKIREVFLLIFIISMGTIISLYYSGRLSFLEFNLNKYLKGEPFIFEEIKTIEPPIPEKLIVFNPRGEVIVNQGVTEKIEIYWEKEVWAEDEEIARSKAEKISLAVNKTSTEVSIRSALLTSEKISFHSYLRISVPFPLSIKIDNSHGLVEINGLKEASLNNAHGPIKVSHLAGDLSVNNRHGDITIEAIEGKAEILSNHGQVSLHRAQGQVKIDARYGHLDLEEIDSAVEIKAEHLAIRGRKIKGPVHIATSYEPIDIKQVGASQITNRFGLIRIQEARGELIVENRYAPIEITDFEGHLSISGKNSRVRGELIKADLIQINMAYDNIDLKNFLGPTTIVLRHGNCTLAPISLKSGINFDGHYASLRLLWPNGETPPTEIRVRYGKILWQLDSPVNQFESNSETVLRAFLAGAKNPIVFIKSSYGQIMVETAQEERKSYFSLGRN